MSGVAPMLTLTRTIAADIKIAHSVFALPFALLGAVMAAAPDGVIGDGRTFAMQIGLVVTAMVLARTVAMLANRMLDRDIDAANPRTAGRAMPSGRLHAATAGVVLAGAAAGFMTVCWAFGALAGNWWPLRLGGPVLLWISVYPLFKRFTALSHLYLGASLAISPLAAALAINPDAIATQPAIWMLSGMVLCWVAGFDVIYALQDVDVDRAAGLHSMPSRLGVPAAMMISRALHAAAVLLLCLAVMKDDRLGPIFGAAVVAVAALLVAEHATVARWGTSRMALAFFTLNGVISCVLGAAGIADVLA